MNEALEYVLGVVVIPAAVSAAIALPFLFRPLRRHATLVEAGLGAAMALAFLLSFVSELDWRAVARQVATIEGDDAPFERWHRLGLVAAALVPAAILVGLRRWRRPVPLGMMLTIEAAIVAAVATAVFVQFPGSTTLVQIGQGALVFASILAWTLAGPAVLWSAWTVFGTLAALAGLGGFASLAVMCGAMSVCAFAIACVAAVAPGAARASSDAVSSPASSDAVPTPASSDAVSTPASTGAVPTPAPDAIGARGALIVVLGTMSALIARCGMAYDTLGVSPAVWTAAVLLPLAGIAFSRRVRATPRPAMRTFWCWIGTALLALALLGTVALSQGGSKSDDTGGDDMMDMYGG